MNEAEKERLIKEDIVSIENRVRHAFNQGYEMGLKENKSEIPTGCGDAISRADARHLIAETNRNALGYISTKVFKILYDGIDKLPPVSPQPIESEDRKKSLEAWKNVQKEIYSQIDALDEIHEFRDKNAYFKALDIINKYLKEVEE